jgi:hypothetical protein
MKPSVIAGARSALFIVIVELFCSSPSRSAEESVLQAPPAAVAEQFREWRRNAERAFDPNPIGGSPQPLVRPAEQATQANEDIAPETSAQPASDKPLPADHPRSTGSTSSSTERKNELVGASSANRREFEEWWKHRTREQAAASAKVQSRESRAATRQHVRSRAAPPTLIAARKKRVIADSSTRRASAPAPLRWVTWPVRRAGRTISCMMRPGCRSGRHIAGAAVGATAGAIIARGPGAIVGGVVGIAATSPGKSARVRSRQR